MFSWTARSQVLPIGIQVGRNAVRMVQLRSDCWNLEMLAGGMAELSPSDGGSSADGLTDAAMKIKETLACGPFRRRQCVLSLPPEMTFIHHVKVPKVKADQIARIVRMQLKNKLTNGIDEMVLQHVVAGEISVGDKTQYEVIVIAAYRHVVQAYLAMAEKAGLDVVSVDAEACAVVQSFWHLMRGQEDSSRAVLFVHIGQAHTQVVLTRGKNMVFARNIPFGGGHFDQVAADALGVSLEQARHDRQEMLQGRGNAAAASQVYRLIEAKIEEMATEFSHCLQYYESVFGQSGVELAIFVGSQTADKYICQALAKRLNLPAKMGDPLLGIKRNDASGMEAASAVQGGDSDWTIPIGLSLSPVWGQ